MTRVSMACPVPPVTRDLQDSLDHQANQELVVDLVVDLVQVVPEPQVFPGHLAQRERKVTKAYQATAPKDSPALLDSLDPPALLDFQAPPLDRPFHPVSSILMGPKVLPPESLGCPAPEESRVNQDTMASEVILATVTAWEEAPRGCLGYLDPWESTATPASPDERVSLVTPVHLALMVFRELLVVLVQAEALVVRERKGRLTTPSRVRA